MGRKKKKKRPEETPGLGASVEPQAEAGFDSSDDGEVGEDELTGPQLLTAEPARKLKAAPAVAEAAPKPGESAPAQPSLLARLSAWWKGGTDLAGEEAGRGGVRWTPESAPPPAVPAAAPPVVPAEPTSESAGEPEGMTPAAEETVPPSTSLEAAVETSLAMAAQVERLTEKLQHREQHLESLRQQRNELQQQLQAEQEAARSRGQVMEEEALRLRSAAESSIEPVREQLEQAERRIQSLEIELARSRDDAEAARAILGQEESRYKALEAELTTRTSTAEEQLPPLRQEKEALETRVRGLERGFSEAGRGVEAAEKRIRELEADLAHSRAESERLKPGAAGKPSPQQELEEELGRQRNQTRKLEDKVQELARQLAARDQQVAAGQTQAEKDLAQARQEAKRALTQLRDLEAALRQAEEAAREREAELSAQKRLVESLQEERTAPARKPGKAAAAGAEPVGAAFAEQADKLYRQAVTPLTTLVASADLLVMEPRLDASTRETAQDIKAQSQALAALLKKFAQGSEK